MPTPERMPTGINRVSIAEKAEIKHWIRDFRLYRNKKDQHDAACQKESQDKRAGPSMHRRFNHREGEKRQHEGESAGACPVETMRRRILTVRHVENAQHQRDKTDQRTAEEDRVPVEQSDQNASQSRAESEACAKRNADKAENPDARR